MLQTFFQGLGIALIYSISFTILYFFIAYCNTIRKQRNLLK
jgi:hypothetical protein